MPALEVADAGGDAVTDRLEALVRKLKLQLQAQITRYGRLKATFLRESTLQRDAMVEYANKQSVNRKCRLTTKKMYTKRGCRRSRKAYGLIVAPDRDVEAQSVHGNGFVLTWESMCKRVAEGHRHHGVLASMYGISKQMVPRVFAMVAACSLERQTFCLADIEEVFRATPPGWTVAVAAWDETSERLALNAVEGLAGAQAGSTWEVLVSRLEIIWSLSRALCVRGLVPASSFGYKQGRAHPCRSLHAPAAWPHSQHAALLAVLQQYVS